MIAICTQVFQMCDSNTTKLKVIQGRVPLAAKHKTTQEQLGLVERSKRVKAADLCPRAAADRGSVGLNNGGICQFRHTLLESPEHHVKEGGLPIINLMWQLLFLESGGDGLQVIIYFPIFFHSLFCNFTPDPWGPVILKYWNLSLLKSWNMLKPPTVESRVLDQGLYRDSKARVPGMFEWTVKNCDSMQQLFSTLDMLGPSIPFNTLQPPRVSGSSRAKWQIKLSAKRNQKS